MTDKKSTAKPATRKKTSARRKCGCMSVHQWLLEQYPDYRAKQIELEHSFSTSRRTARIIPKKPFVLTVVVHVLYSNPAQKITKTQVKSQLKVLNHDYRAKTRIIKKRLPSGPVW